MVIIAVSFEQSDTWKFTPPNSALITGAQSAYDAAIDYGASEIDVIFVVDGWGKCEEYKEGDFES
jgi:hypothetical protein